MYQLSTGRSHVAPIAKRLPRCSCRSPREDARSSFAHQQTVRDLKVPKPGRGLPHRHAGVERAEEGSEQETASDSEASGREDTFNQAHHTHQVQWRGPALQEEEDEGNGLMYLVCTHIQRVRMYLVCTLLWFANMCRVVFCGPVFACVRAHPLCKYRVVCTYCIPEYNIYSVVILFSLVTTMQVYRFPPVDPVLRSRHQPQQEEVEMETPSCKFKFSVSLRWSCALAPLTSSCSVVLRLPCGVFRCLW